MINMFQNATAKLTLIYMGILTIICLFFSYNWYSIATAELDRSLQRQYVSVSNKPRLLNDRLLLEEILEDTNDRYEEAKSTILKRVIVSNVLIITTGTLGSYLLAKRTLEPIEKAHQEQLRFTADASHELRTPLGAMKTEIEVTLRDKNLSKKDAVAQLVSNLEELDKLTSLSEGLLKLSRQDESVGVSIEAVSLDALINKAVSRIEKAAEHKKIKIVQEITEQKVMADFDTMTELIVILLDNAIKYCPENTAIEIYSHNNSNYVTVSVKDSGIGVRRSDQQYIFDRFYRADNSRSSQNVKGHGLGLSIAKNISDIHGAKISVKSAGAGRGSTFSFRLKRA